MVVRNMYSIPKGGTPTYRWMFVLPTFVFWLKLYKRTRTYIKIATYLKQLIKLSLKWFDCFFMFGLQFTLNLFDSVAPIIAYQIRGMKYKNFLSQECTKICNLWFSKSCITDVHTDEVDDTFSGYYTYYGSPCILFT